MKSLVTLIIADDVKQYREAIRTGIDKELFQVISEAENGLELLKQLEVCVPDVILLDIKMPEMDGRLAMTTLLKKYPTAKILIISDYAEQILIDDFILRGARGYLPKDQLLELESAILRVHQGQIYRYHRKNTKKNVTVRHKEILTNLAIDMTQEDSAKELGITRIGLAKAEKKIKQKFGAETRKQLINIVKALGLNFLGPPRGSGS